MVTERSCGCAARAQKDQVILFRLKIDKNYGILVQLLTIVMAFTSSRLSEGRLKSRCSLGLGAARVTLVGRKHRDGGRHYRYFSQGRFLPSSIQTSRLITRLPRGGDDICPRYSSVAKIRLFMSKNIIIFERLLDQNYTDVCGTTLKFECYTL